MSGIRNHNVSDRHWLQLPYDDDHDGPSISGFVILLVLDIGSNILPQIQLICSPFEDI